MSDETLRKLVREILEQELEEVSATGNAPGYQTPNAFAGSDAASKKKRRQNATQAGYELIDGQTLDEARSHYSRFKGQHGSPKQKIGRSLMELSRALEGVERAVDMSARLKIETNTESAQLWKRTIKHIMKIERRLISIARKVQELKYER